jgi:uncharacterized protein (UPF0218 family)
MDDHSSIEEAELASIVSAQVSDIENTVAYGLIQDAIKLNKVNTFLNIN